MSKARTTAPGVPQLVSASASAQPHAALPEPAPSGSPPMPDDEVLRLARAARNGAKFAALFDKGEGGKDASSNDAALLALLAFYTQDAEQLDRLFRASALLRDKWDSARGSTTYGAHTIAQVLAMPSERYRPRVTNSRPYGAGRFDVSDMRGVEFVGTDKDGGESPPLWLCSRLDVLASTRNTAGHEWGRLLQWLDDDNRTHQWAMPSELLQGEGTDVRRELAGQGVHITPSRKGRELLGAYLQSWRVDARALCVDRLGWHGSVYVTPGEVFGDETDERVVFQSATALSPALSVAGTLEDWRATVAALAAGNSRLVFALCTAFAGPLADLASEDSGGFHFRGGTSQGKSSALHLAASVWGQPKAYTRLWRATANGLEGLAVLHNDGLLILDELGQCDPKEVGEAAYMLANGQGKARASRTGAARPSTTWRVLFLSSGEVSLSSLMAQAGARTKAGQEVRLADIEADAGKGLGLFEDLHGHPTAAGFALALKDAAQAVHGAAGFEWLRHLARERANLADNLRHELAAFCALVTPTGATGAVERVARRFALVAVAGDLASACGLTGWAAGEAQRAARACFEAWLEGFGSTGSCEERTTLAQVRAFFEAHGASRFQEIGVGLSDELDLSDSRRILNRAGFVTSTDDNTRVFYVLPEAFTRDVCAGLDAKAAGKLLVAKGWIKPGSNGKTSRTEKLPGMGERTRVYVFTAKMWEDLDPSDQ